MRLLLTRPREDAEALATILRARGHSVVIAPVMEVRYAPGPPLELAGVQGIIATSANGIRAFGHRTDRRDLTIYAVGPQTAEAARSEGFPNVVSADGDSAALVKVVAKSADPERGILLHAAGAETAGRLRQSLQAHGFRVETAVLYEAAPAGSLTPEALECLRNNALDGVLLFSPRSAKIFATLVSAAQLAGSLERLEAYCISAATAAALAPLTFARVAVAGEPNQDAMLALIPAEASGS